MILFYFIFGGGEGGYSKCQLLLLQNSTRTLPEHDPVTFHFFPHD